MACRLSPTGAYPQPSSCRPANSARPADKWSPSIRALSKPHRKWMQTLPNNPDSAVAMTRAADRGGTVGHTGHPSSTEKWKSDDRNLVTLDGASARRTFGRRLLRRHHRNGVPVPGNAPDGAVTNERRLELAIAAALLLFLSAGLAFAEMPVGKVGRSPTDAPAKPTAATEDALREQAIGDCERIWDRGTHMTKQEWSRTCRRVQTRLQRLDVR